MVFLWQTRVKKSPFILLDIALSTICPEASVSHDRWSIYHHPSKPPRSNNNNNNNNNEHLAAGPSCPESRTSQESRTWEGGSHRSKVIIAGGGGLSLPDLIPTRLHLRFFGCYLCFYDYSSCIHFIFSVIDRFFICHTDCSMDWHHILQTIDIFCFNPKP